MKHLLFLTAAIEILPFLYEWLLQLRFSVTLLGVLSEIKVVFFRNWAEMSFLISLCMMVDGKHWSKMEKDFGRECYITIISLVIFLFFFIGNNIIWLVLLEGKKKLLIALRITCMTFLMLSQGDWGCHCHQ